MQPPLVSKLELEFLLQELCQAWVHLHLQGSAVAQLALHQVSSLPFLAKVADPTLREPS